MNNLKNYSGVIIGTIIILFLTTMCINGAKNYIEGQTSILEAEKNEAVTKLEKQLEESEKNDDSLKNVISKHFDKIESLEKENNKLNNRIASLLKQRDENKNKAKNSSKKECAEFFVKRYDAEKSVSYTEKEVSLRDSVPNKIMEELVDNDYYAERAFVDSLSIDNCEMRVQELDSVIIDKDIIILNKEKDNKAYSEALQKSNTLSDSYKKENKKLKNLNFIDKLLIGASFFLGVIIAK